MRTRFLSRRLAPLCGLALALGLALPALATDLPAGVLNYLRQKDPAVQVRFDGLVLFSNGESYVPVIPQDPGLNPDPQQVIMSLPEKAAYPDMIEFDNHFFLMRLIQTSSGRLTFPKMDEYPIQLKEGLLPQDFVIPSNLFIPVELKVILGALPYNPNYVPPKNQTAMVPAQQILKMPEGTQSSRAVTPHLTYVFDLNDQKVLAIEPSTGRKLNDIALDCVPSSLKLSPDGRLLFAPCLSTNEVAVVDTGSNLVKTRIPVGQRPDSLLTLESGQALVSNRYSAFLSTIDTVNLLPGEKITLPGNSGAIAPIPGDKGAHVLVADASKPQVYLVDMTTHNVRTIPSIGDVSAIRVLGNELWLASRNQNKVQVLDLTSGAELKKFDVGEKPVEFAVSGNRLYVLAAGSARIDVIDWANKLALEPVSLPEGSFPSSLVSMPSEDRAYITTAGATDLIIFNLASGQVENTLPVEFRGSMITMTPDPADNAPVANAIPSLPPITENPAVTPEKPGKGRKKAPKEPNRKKPAATETVQQAAPEKPEAQAAEKPVETAPVRGVYGPGVSQLPARQPGKFSLKLGREEKKKETEAQSEGSGLPAKPATLHNGQAMPETTNSGSEPPAMLEAPAN